MKYTNKPMDREEFLQSVNKYYKGMLRYMEKHETTDKIMATLDAITKAYDIMKKKNSDYANNETLPFTNFYCCEDILGIKAETGILVRLIDKAARISNLALKQPEVTSESLSDTIIDSINYLAILKHLSFDRTRQKRLCFLYERKQKKLGKVIDQLVLQLLFKYNGVLNGKEIFPFFLVDLYNIKGLI